MSEPDVALACAFAFVDQLVFEGVESACISPGSRSTPIALAAARHPKVRVHVHLDERASAFFALGIAKATQRPVAVITTSGTAAAELLPAVVEAHMSRMPLILLTADRPRELHGIGANQTIDQTELYGTYTKTFLHAPVPGDDPDERGWRQRAEFLATTATQGPPGPVHGNLPFREPLVGSGTASVSGGGRRIADVVSEEQIPSQRDELLREIDQTARGVFVVGSLRSAEPALLRFADRLQWPVLAEPTSGLRVPGTLEAGQFLISNEAFVSDHEPDLIVQVGASPTTRAGLAFVARAKRLWIVDPDRLVADPSRVAMGRVVVPLGRVLDATDRVRRRDADAWRGTWLEADERARPAVDTLIDGWSEPFEGRVARDVAASLPDGSTLVVGSSMPVRDLDAYMRPRDRLRVLANRGASGIDGFVSTTLGVSATGATTTALCGDLTLLHDVGSLLWSAKRDLDCVFVVPNNDGGAIFSFLPQRELPELEELFVTPHGLDLGVVCRAAGAGHTLVEHADELIPAVDRARDVGGVHVIEVPTDRERNVELHAAVHQVVATALGGSSM